MNRPQFFYSTPDGFTDIPYVRPLILGADLSTTIPVGGYLNDVIIQMDNDAPTLVRSLFIEGLQQGQNPNLQIRMRDAFGNYITDGYVPFALFAEGAGATPPDGGSGRAKVFEPELYWPPGSVLTLDFYNPG